MSPKATRNTYNESRSFPAQTWNALMSAYSVSSAANVLARHLVLILVTCYMEKRTMSHDNCYVKGKHGAQLCQRGVATALGFLGVRTSYPGRLCNPPKVPIENFTFYSGLFLIELRTIGSRSSTTTSLVQCSSTILMHQLLAV